MIHVCLTERRYVADFYHSLYYTILNPIKKISITLHDYQFGDIFSIS